MSEPAPTLRELVAQLRDLDARMFVAQNGHANGAHDTSSDVLSYGDVLDMELPPERPIIAGLLGEDTGAIIGGAPNVGKSWLTLAMARAIASGTPFLGEFPTTQHTVLIVDEESHLRGIIGRARMMERAVSLGRDLPLLFAVGLGIRVDAGTAVSRLDALMTKYQPSLVIADSLTRVHTANENSASEMARVFLSVKDLMRKHSCAFVFTDHTRKKGLINDPEETLRGSTEKRAWADSIFAVESDEQDRMQLVITHTKARHEGRREPFGVRLEIDQVEGTTHLRYTGAATSNAPSKANDIIAAIHSLQEQLGADGACAITIAAWMNCSPDTAERHAKKLVTAGILAKRSVESGTRGRPKTVYDVKGGMS